MSEWIKTAERLPPRNIPVLVAWRRPTAWGATWQFDVAKFGGKRWLEPMPEPNEEFTTPDCWREIEPPEAIARAAQETTSAPTEHAVHGGRIMTLRECMEAEETSPVQAVCDRAAHLADVSKRASCDGCGEDATDRCPHCQATTCGKCAVCEHSALNR